MQTVINNDNYCGCTYVHQKRRHPDAENTHDNASFKTVKPFLKMDVAFFIHEVVKYPDHTDELRNDRCRACSAHTPLEMKDKDRSQYNVASYCHHRGKHCFFRITCSPHHIVQSYHGVRYRCTKQYYLHEIPCIGQCAFACSEETEYIVQKIK